MVEERVKGWPAELEKKGLHQETEIFQNYGIVSEVTRTCRNPFEKPKSKETEFFVREDPRRAVLTHTIPDTSMTSLFVPLFPDQFCP